MFCTVLPKKNKIKLRGFIWQLCTFLLVVVLPSLALAEEKSDFETRGQVLLLHFVEEETGISFSGVAARYAAGERIGEAHRMMSELTAAPSSDVSYTFKLIATYLFGRQNLPFAIAEKVPQLLSSNVPIRHDYEHEWLMYYATIILAAETWPDMIAEKWFNGKSSSENHQDAKAYINEWIESAVENGQREYDSPQFMPSFFASFALLHEFTRDDDLRKRLKVILNLIMLDFASEHLDGLYAGAHSRIEKDQIISPRDALSAGFAWLYFGSGKMVPSPELLFASLSGYTLPNVIFELATNRDPLGGYVHLERKQPYRFNRYQDPENIIVNKYAYVTRHYILGSIQGGVFYPKDQHSWGLTYFSPNDRRPGLFMTYPSVSEYELAAFYTEETRVLLADAEMEKNTNSVGFALTGASAYERILQHRNVLISLYHPPDSLGLVDLNGFFSEDLNTLEAPVADSVESEPQWIFCRAGSTFIAVFPLQAFHLEKTAGGQIFYFIR